MKSFFSALGWFCAIVVILIASLTIAVIASWSTLTGVVLFLSLFSLLIIIYITIKKAPDIFNIIRRLRFFKRHASNPFERLLWQHWWRGGRVQSWRRYLAQWQGRATPPPWFLITGPKGSGKANLLNKGHVSLLPEKNGVFSSNRFSTCRWWFFGQAMYLLVAGRCVDGSLRYRQAWFNLTRWMSKVRRPSGVIVCLPMEMLLTAEPKALYAAARSMRDQLEPLQLGLGHRLPIWLMVTGLEAIPGFSQWCSQLPDETRQELLGCFIEENMDGNVAGALEECMLKVTAALQTAGLKMCTVRRTQPEYAQLELPERIAELQPALCCYARALFESDRYQQHGLLRGLFFSAHITPEGRTQPENFFSVRLLEEYLPVMAQRYTPVPIPCRRSLIKGLLWGAVILFIASLLLSGLLKTYRGVAQLDDVIHQPPQKQRYLRFQQLEAWRQTAHWSSLLFYPVTYMLEKRIAAPYLYQPGSDLFEPTDNIVKQLRQQFSLAGVNQRRDLILNWVRFINTEQAMVSGASLATLQALPMWSSDLLSGKKTSLPAEQNVALRLAAWRLGDTHPNLALYRSVLKTMLEQSSDWQWLLTDDDIAQTSSLTLADFWPISDELANKADARISGKYTETGHQILVGIINEVGQALKEPAWFAMQRKHVLSLYQQQQQIAWLTFSQAMPEGESLVRGKKEWQSMILSISQSDSPYMKFLRRMTRDLSDINDENQQEWLHTQRKLWQLQSYLQKSHLMKRVSLGNISLRQRILSSLGISPQVSVQLNDTVLSRYQNWRQAIETSGQQVLAGEEEAGQMVKTALSYHDEASKDNALNTMFIRFSLWRNATQSQPYQGSDEFLWRLWQGDARLIMQYAAIATAAQLQSQWETNVIWPIEKLKQDNLIDEKELNARLYEYVTGFVRDKAAFALQIHPKGITPREKEGISIPLYDSFIFYLNGVLNPEAMLSSTPQIRRRLLEKQLILKSDQDADSDRPQQDLEAPAEITLTSLPATANRGAWLLPTGSTFTLQCQDNLQQLSSMNFKESKVIKWNPQSCGAVQIDVRFPTFTLSKRFEGADGLLKFMSAFSGNELTLAASLFPEQRDTLNAMHINNIIVRYQIRGQEQVSALYTQWQNNQQQRISLQRQSAEIDTQIANLNQPDIARGSFSNLPQDITAGWNY